MLGEVGPEGFDSDVLGRLIDDLRVIREHGLVGIRGLELPAIRATVAGSLGPGRISEVTPVALERLLAAAVERLGGDRAGDAAKYSFGLAQGTKFWSASERRRSAAQAQGVSVERFRKGYEPQLIEQVAEERVVPADLVPVGSVPRG